MRGDGQEEYYWLMVQVRVNTTSTYLPLRLLLMRFALFIMNM